MTQVSTTASKFNRRNLLKAIGLAPLTAVVPAVAVASDETEQRLIALIGELETPQGHETSIAHYAKAFAAAEIRRVLNLPIPDSENLQQYYLHLEEQKVWRRKWDEIRASGKS